MATTIQQIELPKKARAVDTSGNNNHGQIYSGRGLEFDGITDYLSVPISTSVSPTANITVACWVHRNVSGNWATLWGKLTGHSKGVWLAIDSLGELRCQLEGVVAHASFAAGDNKMLDGVWYRVVMTYDSTVGGVLYINGQSVGTTSETGAITQPATNNYQIGTNNSGYIFNGMMSDFQLWDSTWTATDVTYDYLNPESLALNNSGTALTESNLKLWYPMQDGHRGQQSYILDGANTGAVVELVTNGSFTGITQAESTTGSEWTTSAGWSIGDGVILAEAGSATKLIQTNTLNGKFCKVTLTLSNYGGAGLVLVDFGTVSSSYITSNGTHTVYGTYDQNNFEIYKTSTFSGTIDNISVKQINDKHHATTVFYGDTLYDAAASTDGSVANWEVFGSNTKATDSGAVKGTYAGDTPSASGIFIRFRDATDLSSDLTIGRTYQFQYDIKVNTGSVTPRIARSGTGGTTYTGDEVTSTEFVTKTIDFVCDDVDDHYFYTADMSAGEIVYLDNFSLKEVGVASGWTDADQQLHIPQTALQSYNELAWFDGHNDLVSISDDNSLDVTSITISAWLNTAVVGLEKAAVAKSYATTFEFGINANAQPHVNCKINGVYNSHMHNTGTALAVNTWNHVAWTYDRSSNSSKTYLNGVLNETVTPNAGDGAGLGINADSLFIGGRSTSALQWNGSITEVGIWSSAITSDEVQAIFNDGKALDVYSDSGSYASSGDLVSYWRNNGLSTWTDLKGSNNGTPTNITETILIPQGVDSTRDAQGFIMNKQKSTSCLNLSEGSSEDYVLVKNNPTLQFASGGSVGFWMKPKGTPPTAGYCILNNGAGGSRNPRVTLQSNFKINLFWEIADGTNKDTNATSAVTEGEWTYVVCTWDGTTNKIYLNNALDKSEAESGTPDTDTADLYIGKDQTGSDGNFKGYLDGITFYSDVLSLEEVQRNYNATKGSHRN